MAAFEIVYYQKTNGREPAKEFLDSLPDPLKAKGFRDVNLLRERGPELRGPVSKYLADGLFELRIQTAGDSARVFYFFFSEGKIILTNRFVKKSQKTPLRELRRALRYKRDWERRQSR